MKSKTLFAAVLLLLFGVANLAVGQISDADLEKLLGPVALYPDPLLAQILPAATQPSQVHAAELFLQVNQDPAQIAQQPWDDSVKALTHYPAVLKWLDDNTPWTTAVGQEFLASQQRVMDAVQRLRAKAAALGNLNSTPQQQVVANDGQTEILPADPDEIYVPVYQPDQVYYDPPPIGGGWISFGVGFPVGLWLGGDFDWRHHHILLWPRDHPRPRGWWGLAPGRRPAPGYGGRAAASWEPRRGGSSGVGSRGPDRGWGAFEVGPHARPDLEGASRPSVVPRPVERPFEPAPRVSESAARGAMIGVHSVEETHSYSTRGASSRATISRGGGGGGHGGGRR
jgi:hypothetical protein